MKAVGARLPRMTPGHVTKPPNFGGRAVGYPECCGPSCSFAITTRHHPDWPRGPGVAWPVITGEDGTPHVRDLEARACRLTSLSWPRRVPLQGPAHRAGDAEDSGHRHAGVDANRYRYSSVPRVRCAQAFDSEFRPDPPLGNCIPTRTGRIAGKIRRATSTRPFEQADKTFPACTNRSPSSTVPGGDTVCLAVRTRWRLTNLYARRRCIHHGRDRAHLQVPSQQRRWRRKLGGASAARPDTAATR